MKFLGMAAKLLKDTNPGATRGMKAASPGSKWKQYLLSIIDETDPTSSHHDSPPAATRLPSAGLRNTSRENAVKCRATCLGLILLIPAVRLRTSTAWLLAAEITVTGLDLTSDEMDKLVTEAEALGARLFMLTSSKPLSARRTSCQARRGAPRQPLQHLHQRQPRRRAVLQGGPAPRQHHLLRVAESYRAHGQRRPPPARLVPAGHRCLDDLMRQYGLFYGTSTLLSRANVERVSSDEFMDLIIAKGCRYAWYFHYMPVGDGANTNLMPGSSSASTCPPHPRGPCRRGWQARVFAMDFQNDGRVRGRLHRRGRGSAASNARGDVEPCILIHYSNVNIRDIGRLTACTSPSSRPIASVTPGTTCSSPAHARTPTSFRTWSRSLGGQELDYTSPRLPSSSAAHRPVCQGVGHPKAKELWLDERPDGRDAETLCRARSSSSRLRRSPRRTPSDRSTTSASRALARARKHKGPAWSDSGTHLYRL